MAHWKVCALCAGVLYGAAQIAHELPAILRTAKQAAARSDWLEVKQCLGDLRSLGLASNPDLGVQVLLLQAEALRNLQQQTEALEVSSCANCNYVSCVYTQAPFCLTAINLDMACHFAIAQCTCYTPGLPSGPAQAV